jgi:hypothetical protein
MTVIMRRPCMAMANSLTERLHITLQSKDSLALMLLVNKRTNRRSTKEHAEIKYGSILIVTYGRSSSTLLQGVLNTIDGVRVTGENFEFSCA